MQAFMRILQVNWSEVTGWGLILGGLGIAGWTLGKNGEPVLGATAKTSAPRPVPVVHAKPARRLGPEGEWQTVMEIAERGFACIERLGDLQESAREQVEAADDALSQLLAECAAAFTPAAAAASPALEERLPSAAPLPVRVSEPLAA